MDCPTDDIETLQGQLSLAQAYVTAGARLIDEQIRSIQALVRSGRSTAEEDLHLDILIKLQAAHVAHRDTVMHKLKLLMEE